MNLRTSYRLPVLFVLVVALPSALLAYLGFQAIDDEGDRALQEQDRLASRLRVEFDSLIEGAVEQIRLESTIPPDSAHRIQVRPPEPVEHLFILDSQGNWVVPRIERDPRPSPSAESKTRMAAGEYFEFVAEDLDLAMEKYREAAAESSTAVDQATALLALGRCALKLGRMDRALETYMSLIDRCPTVLDENGAHPATYAHFQLAKLFAERGDMLAAAASLKEWLHALSQGKYPFREGAMHDVQQAEEILRSTLSGCPDQSAVASLSTSLQHVRSLVQFAEQFEPVIASLDLAEGLPATRSSPADVLLRAGHSPDGPYLIAIVPASLDRFLGLYFDLGTVRARLLDTAAGRDAMRSGFDVAILDDHTVGSFEEIHRDALATVVRLSDRVIGLSLGLYARDSARVLGQYRQRRWLLLSAVSLLIATIGFGGYLVVRDASREVALSRLRSDFVSNVSHELKTPLASIRLHAETLLMGRFRNQTEQTDCVQTILSESGRLTRLVDNVLDFSRTERDARTYRFQDEDLAEVARSCLHLFQHRLEEEGFTVESRLPDTIPALPIDRDAVTGAILNLLDNAVKYASAQRNIGYAAYETPEGAVVEVVDHGPGIPEQELSRIFESFYRIESETGKMAGAGLGLTLVRLVMDAHGGRVEAESTVGQGSTFRLVFARNSERTTQWPLSS